MTDTIRVIYKPVGGRYEIREIPNTLEACPMYQVDNVFFSTGWGW